jgi:hypothetical protein
VGIKLCHWLSCRLPFVISYDKTGVILLPFTDAGTVAANGASNNQLRNLLPQTTALNNLPTNWPTTHLGVKGLCLGPLHYIKSKSKLSYDRRSVGQSILVSGHQLGPATDLSFSSMEIIIRYLPFFYYGAPSLTRGWVCNLRFPMDLTSAVPWQYFTVSVLRLPHLSGSGCYIYFPQEQGARHTPRYSFPSYYVKTELIPTFYNPVRTWQVTH